MKTKSLQFGKAMSAALFVLLLSVAGMKNALAQNQVATLQHGDDISVFYGQNGYSSACSAAVDGDIITLSSGTFAGSAVSKSITVHGAGCVYDSVTNVLPTKITGDFAISHNDVLFEGIWFTGSIRIPSQSVSFGPSSSYSNICFEKCNIAKIYNNSNTAYYTYFLQFNNCLINDCSSRLFHGTSIVNSVVKFSEYTHTDVYNLTSIYNSIILFDNGLAIKNINAFNSIVVTISGHAVSNCTFNNCIGIQTGETSLFDGQIVQNVITVNDYSDVFETFAGTVFYDNWYQIKEEIATSFLGNDGTEVGIYGGMLPYTPRPSYMIIKRCNVAPRSTVDGKLSVDIEVLTDDE